MICDSDIYAGCEGKHEGGSSLTVSEQRHSQRHLAMSQSDGVRRTSQRHPHDLHRLVTGRERLIRSYSSARFCFELSGNSNSSMPCNSNFGQNFELEMSLNQNFELEMTKKFFSWTNIINLFADQREFLQSLPDLLTVALILNLVKFFELD